VCVHNMYVIGNEKFRDVEGAVMMRLRYGTMVPIRNELLQNSMTDIMYNI